VNGPQLGVGLNLVVPGRDFSDLSME
jgi:hypothetical protein